MYPYPLLSKSSNIHPLFGNQIKGEPHFFDLSVENPMTMEYDTQNYGALQKSIFDELYQSGKKWGLSGYLEKRSGILRNFPQMIEQGRVYHLGLDIVVPYGFDLYAPLDAVVEEVGKEDEPGSYGGYAILKHEVQGCVFYAVYGHLKTPHTISVGDRISKGDVFARIGKESDSGGWFTHTHLQIVTEAGKERFGFDLGYIAEEHLPTLDRYFPNPCFLFRY